MSRAARLRQKGFTLIELMVALVIGLIIILGAGQLFLMGLQSFRQIDRMAERQEVLRFFSDVVSFDVRTASEAIVEDDNKIELSYFTGVRQEEIYCGSGEDLMAILYEYDGGEGVVSLSYICTDDTIDNTNGEPPAVIGPEPIFSNIAGLSFSVFDNHVDISVSFPPLDAEESGEVVFNFKVARRNAIISRL